MLMVSPSMMIDDLDVPSLAVAPCEADSPLVVDAHSSEARITAIQVIQEGL
jgi:hypothetical protein